MDDLFNDSVMTQWFEDTQDPSTAVVHISTNDEEVHSVKVDKFGEVFIR